jgi:outer membrane protein with beta-barrel domain
MKRVIWIIPAILVLSFTARAQETPAWDVSGGFSYLQADFSGANFHLFGATTSATENLNSWFGGRIEVNAYHGSEAGTTVSAQTITYGPVFSYRRLKTVTPFAHVQLGAVHASAGYLGISQSAIKFAMSGGGGADVQINKIVSVRVQADYLMTRFLSLGQNNLQGSVGMVFRFGHK